jgi:hypothetical protein
VRRCIPEDSVKASASREFPDNANRSRTMQFEFDSMVGTPPNQLLD